MTAYLRDRLLAIVVSSFLLVSCCTASAQEQSSEEHLARTLFSGLSEFAATVDPVTSTPGLIGRLMKSIGGPAWSLYDAEKALEESLLEGNSPMPRLAEIWASNAATAAAMAKVAPRCLRPPHPLWVMVCTGGAIALVPEAGNLTGAAVSRGVENMEKKAAGLRGGIPAIPATEHPNNAKRDLLAQISAVAQQCIENPAYGAEELSGPPLRDHCSCVAIHETSAALAGRDEAQRASMRADFGRMCLEGPDPSSSQKELPSRVGTSSIGQQEIGIPSAGQTRQVLVNILASDWKKLQIIPPIFEITKFDYVAKKESIQDGKRILIMYYDIVIYYPDGIHSECINNFNVRCAALVGNARMRGFQPRPKGSTDSFRFDFNFDETDRGWMGDDGKIYTAN